MPRCGATECLEASFHRDVSTSANIQRHSVHHQMLAQISTAFVNDVCEGFWSSPWRTLLGGEPSIRRALWVDDCFASLGESQESWRRRVEYYPLKVGFGVSQQARVG